MLLIFLLLSGGLKMLKVNELLEIAISEITNINPGEIFLLRDLFKGYEWNRISRSDRLMLGTLFLNYTNTANNEVLKRLLLVSKDTKNPRIKMFLRG